MRHGESRPNVQGIIVSNPVDGPNPEYGLTKKGRQQVLDSILVAQNRDWLDAKTIIIASLFSRAYESAEIIAKVLGSSRRVISEGALRERWFGRFEKTSNQNYQKVWDKDRLDPNHREFGVETAVQVQDRVTDLVNILECRHVNKKFLLVSHGDALQILQTGFAKVSPALHRTMKHLEVAEIRELS